MTTRSTKLAFVAAALFALIPAAAWAQVEGEGEGEGEGEAEVEAGAEAGVTGDGAVSAEGEAGVAVDASADAPVRYPRSVIARPLTLPAGVFQAGDDMASNNDFSILATNLVAGYGINDKLEATLYYAFALKEFEAKGNLDVNVGYAVVRGAMDGKLEAIARVQAGYSPLAEGMRPLGAGVQVQYNLSDKLCLITPGGQFQMALEEDATMAKPITFGLPVAVGFHPTPLFYLQLDTTLATFKIADSANTFIFADTTPAKVTAIYNVAPAIDVAAAIGLDVTPAAGSAGDTLAFLLGVRYYGGEIGASHPRM
jgi:hypothetical protein